MSFRSLLLSGLCQLLLVPVLAGAGGPYIIQDEPISGYLGGHLRMLEDPGGALGIQDVLGSPAFRLNDEEIPSPGITASAFWVRLDLFNASGSDELIIDLPYPEIDELDIHLVRDGQVLPIAHAGLTRPLDRQRQRFPELGFPLSIPTDTEATLYIRVKSFKPLRIPVQVQSTSAFNAWHSQKNVVVGGFVGIMLAMSLYNLFVFFSIRERSYLIYAFYVLVVCLTQLGFLGYSSFYLWPDDAWLSSRSSLLLTAVTAIVASEFMASFMHTRDILPRTMRWLPAFYAALLAGAAVDLLGHPLIGYRLIQAAAAVFAVFLLYAGYRISRLGSRPAKYFLAAWSMFLLGVVTFILKDLGLLPYNVFTRYAMPFGTVAEVLLLSFGLADKIQILRKEKERSHREALRMSRENERIIREQNAMLEQKVKERTRDLQESNEHLKRTQSQLVSAEKMASLGQLTAGIAHEINNPINFISSNIPPLKRDLEDLHEVLSAYRKAGHAPELLPEALAIEARLGLDETIQEVQQILASIEEGASRTSAIVRGLRTFSRLDEDDLKSADVNEGLRSTLAVLTPNLRDEVSVRMELSEMPMIECYPGKLNQVFMNILTNAAQAAKQRHGTQGGEVRVSSDQGQDMVVVSIQDNGVGMSAEVQARIFEPFYTTKDVGEGTGLGLSIVHSIIEKHQGRIVVESTPGQGTIFHIHLPIHHPPVAQRA